MGKGLLTIRKGCMIYCEKIRGMGVRATDFMNAIVTILDVVSSSRLSVGFVMS